MSKEPNNNNNATEFHVDTRFQQMARRPGGISRDEAIARAQGKIEEALPDLDGWLDRELRSLNTLVTDALAGKAERSWIKDANEHARQLRNVGTTIGLELLTYVADILCEMFEQAGKGAECDVNAVKCYVDSMLLARRNEYRNVRPDQVPELVEGLRRVAQQPRQPKPA